MAVDKTSEDELAVIAGDLAAVKARFEAEMRRLEARQTKILAKMSAAIEAGKIEKARRRLNET